jgi:hypothetical protein
MFAAAWSAAGNAPTVLSTATTIEDGGAEAGQRSYSGHIVQ